MIHLRGLRRLPKYRMSLAPRQSYAALSSSRTENAVTNCLHHLKRPLLLVFDFDGTLTCKDTMHLVAGAGYAHQKDAVRIMQPPPWSSIVDAYLSDFETHVSGYRPDPVERTNRVQELAWLDSLEKIEEASFQRALAAGIFDNVTRQEMENAGKQSLQDGRVTLRHGWHELMVHSQRHNEQFSQSPLPCLVLSVNWSATFIRSVLNESLEAHHGINSRKDTLEVYANELPSIRDDIDATLESKGLTPAQHVSVRTSSAKVGLLQSYGDRMGDKESSTLLTYIGDSATDLGCLLAADVGFCIRDDPMGSGQQELADICQRIGVEVYPINGDLDPLEPQASNTATSKPLWWAKDLSEITHWLAKVTDA